MLVGEAVEAYVSDRRARAEIGDRTARQLRWRLGALVELCEGTEIADLDRDHIRRWQAAIGSQRPASRRAYLSTVKVFCRWAADWDLLSGDPCRSAGRVKEPRRNPRGLTAAQMGRLRLVLPDLEARVIVALMGRQGLRCVEVSRLGVEDWDRGRGWIEVRGKADHERGMPVGDDVAALLGAWVGERISGPVIGRPPAALSRMVRAWMEAAGLKAAAYDGNSAHALRHTAASELYEATRDIKAVQRFLGHQNVATTDRYLRTGDDRVIRAGLNAPPGRLYAR
jgi:integrase/recombinase XerC